jgi:hypothetical protein
LLLEQKEIDNQRSQRLDEDMTRRYLMLQMRVDHEKYISTIYYFERNEIDVVVVKNHQE